MRELRERSFGLELALTDFRERTEAEGNQFREQIERMESEREALQIRMAELDARTAELDARTAELDAQVLSLRNETTSLQLERDDLRHRAAALEEGNQHLERELAAARHHVDALLGSMSWRLMAPFRIAARLLLRPQSRQFVAPGPHATQRDPGPSSTSDRAGPPASRQPD